MTSSKQIMLATLVCLLMVLFTVPSSKADTLYTYTGNAFTQFPKGPVCPPFCSVNGSFTVAAPLGANFNGDITPISETLQSGNLVLTLAEVVPALSLLHIETDAQGNIGEWTFVIFGVPGTGRILTQFSPSDPGLDFDTVRFPNSTTNPSGLLIAENFGDPGTWNSSVSTPEPSSLLMLAVGMLGLAGIVMKKSL